MDARILPDLTLVIFEGLLLLVLIILSFYQRKRNKKIAEMVSLQMSRTREESLDASLRNTMYVQKTGSEENSNNPYDVQYHQEEKNVYEDFGEKISVQIEEKGILSTKKYVIHVFDASTVGRDDGNAIVLNDASIAGRQIQLIREEKNLLVRNLDGNHPVNVRRGKKLIPVAGEAVLVGSGDAIMLGNTELKLLIL
ncbi:MAG: FHA domain-containing protein [Lachnospiraceae bacterium]|nr:FHA domain-containing protein [Lachnospiraceae bacterium]